jgi:hypothetical protein
MIEFPIEIGNESAFQRQVEMYLMRHRHPVLVSTMYLKKKGSMGKVSVFFERVFTNLSRIKDISFEDSLQFYYVALKGFDQLFRMFGYFEVEESMLHITTSNRVKVWCSRDISQTKPTQPHSQGTMDDMVKKILTLIEENTDYSGNYFPVGPTIKEEASFSFASALQKLKDICK